MKLLRKSSLKVLRINFTKAGTQLLGTFLFGSSGHIAWHLTAQLECNCKNGKGNINMYHDLGEVEKVSHNLGEANPIQNPKYSEMLRKKKTKTIVLKKERLEGL